MTFAPHTVQISTTAGRIEGLARDETLTFRGIPYAEPPIESRRFRPPELLRGWDGTLDATRYGACAVQSPVPGREEFFGWLNNTAPQSEACLNLNIYAPAKSTDAVPVLVYLHGGAFAFGSSSATVLDGHALARTGKVMVVTVNHRLNIFGFLGTRRLFDTGVGTPNVGILDLVCALRWIKAHCGSFGGDPSRITIMGQSGGAGKVAMLMKSPMAKGLFHRAIIQSTATSFHLQSPNLMEEAFSRVTEKLGAHKTSVDTLLSLGSEAILKCGNDVVASYSGFDPFRPTADGTTLPETTWLSSEVPVLIGHTSGEANFYLFHQIRSGSLTQADILLRTCKFLKIGEDQGRHLLDAYAREFPKLSDALLFARVAGDHMFKLQSLSAADYLVDGGLDNVYAYKFSYCPSRSRPYIGAPHTIELPFVFGNLREAANLVEDPDDAKRISDAMMECWISFASTGSPSSEKLGNWPCFDRKSRNTMVFDRMSSVRMDPDAFERNAFSEVARYVPGSPMTFMSTG